MMQVFVFSFMYMFASVPRTEFPPRHYGKPEGWAPDHARVLFHAIKHQVRRQYFCCTAGKTLKNIPSVQTTSKKTKKYNQRKKKKQSDL